MTGHYWLKKLSGIFARKSKNRKEHLATLDVYTDHDELIRQQAALREIETTRRMLDFAIDRVSCKGDPNETKDTGSALQPGGAGSPQGAESRK